MASVETDLCFSHFRLPSTLTERGGLLKGVCTRRLEPKIMRQSNCCTTHPAPSSLATPELNMKFGRYFVVQVEAGHPPRMYTG